MGTTGNISPVHAGETREPTEPVTIRLRSSVVRLVEAVQAIDGDEYRNDTFRKAVELYVNSRLGISEAA